MSHMRNLETINPDLAASRLAQRLEDLRKSRGWSLDEAALESSISRATLSRMERAETSPTASQLGRICTAYQITMSGLLAEVEANPAQRVPLSSQSVWSDPENGFVRRAALPPAAGYRSEIIHGQLKAGGVIAYDAAPAPGFEQYMMIECGALSFTHADESFNLQTGDALRFRLTGPTRFENSGHEPVRYYVVLTRA
jgi:transcriptional regulator with XRE-family HTH domain